MQSCVILHRNSESAYGNLRTYFRGESGLAVAKNISIVARVKELMHSDPDELLPKHNLLFGKDFEDLTKGAAAHCQYWRANMELAIQTLCQVRNDTVVNERMP